MPLRISKIGGPGSFQRKLATGLIKRGIEVTYNLYDEPCSAVLVINSTRQIARLWRRKKQGIRIVQRLGGINWSHRHLPIGFPGYLYAEIRNLNMRLMRSVMADHVIYQSNFVREWWNRKYKPPKQPSSVIYNGVDLTKFNPRGKKYQSQAAVCIISVEGNQGNDPFDIAINLAKALEKEGIEIELLMFGNSWKGAQSRFTQYHFVKFMGPVPNSELPYFYRAAAFYISTDIIAACPNSVIEALACGTPVLGYKTGVLPELLDESAGRCVQCYGDPFKGEIPGNLEGMVSASCELLKYSDRFSHGARRLAERRYGLDQMVEAYKKVLFT